MMSTETHPPRGALDSALSSLVQAPAAPISVRESPTLARTFQMLIFDWDGTAVANRREDASALARLAEPLLADGCWLVVVTGTSFSHIARQFCDLVAPDCRQRVLVCANRGSEVFGFDERGEAVLRYHREATAEEDRALTAIAETVRDELVRATHLDVQIVYNRLNRRKLDLIPLPEWADPPKSQIDALLEAVETRLAAAGWPSGIAGVVELVRQVATRLGIEVRITSDVKHVEIGLTDKADAVAWVKRELMTPLGIAEHEVLVVGDEFGTVGGFPGSDDRLRVGFEAAPVVSVGVEPNGVPAGVVHLGGGPHAFRELLARQIALRSAQVTDTRGLVPSPTNPQVASLLAPRSPLSERVGWTLTMRGVRLELEHVVESLLAIGNGFVGVRASLEDPHPVSHPRTLIAGLYGATPGGSEPPALVPAPDWLRARLFVDGEPVAWVQAEAENNNGLTRTLDLRRGVLRSEWTGIANSSTPSSPVAIRTLRLVSQVRRGLGIQIIQIEARAAATIVLQGWLALPPRGLAPRDPAMAGTTWQTADGAHILGCRVYAALAAAGRELRPMRQHRAEDRQTWAWEAAPGQVATFVRIVSFARGGQAEQADGDAVAQLDGALAAGVHTLLAEHVRAWRKHWAAGDIRIRGDDEAQQQVRFAIYHLLSAANPEDERVSIGARGLTGEGYLGHVFWDTDIFLVPFYSAVWPAAARALLMYRYHTLSAARARAVQLGYRGAFYAWESADTGEDVTPAEVIGPGGERVVVRSGTLEQHISADVAYAVWQYWHFTHDTRFFLAAGAEIVLETARFWASRCTLEDDGLYHIRRVIGPDEYHEDIDDNAYTNGMARWNLACGQATARMLSARWPHHWRALARRLALTDDELDHWRTVSTRIAATTAPASPQGNDHAPHPHPVIEQFKGYFDLEPIDLATYADRTVPMDVILGREHAQRTQVVKQADVLMLLALLPDWFSRRSVEANYRYYERRTGHGSSLSPAIHALVAARIGELAAAERYFHQAAEIDLNEDAGAAAQGVHMAALGGLWSAVALGFAGILPRRGALHLQPNVPAGWRSLALTFRWRGRRLRYRIQQAPLRVMLQHTAGAAPIPIVVGNLRHRLSVSAAWTCWWDDATASWKEGAP